jgi:hypothetical protein
MAGKGSQGQGITRFLAALSHVFPQTRRHLRGVLLMPETPSDFHDRLATAWRDALKQAQAEAAQKQRPAPQATEEFFVRIAMVGIWIAGVMSCFLLAWRLTGGSLFVTGLTVALPLAAWCLCGFYRWGLLLPLSLLALLAVQGALLLW